MSQIALKHIDVTLQGKTVLAVDELTIAPQQLTAVIGPNGAGKTTLLRTFLGLIPNAAGTITIDGRNRTELSAREQAQHLVWLPRNRSLPFAITGRQAVMMGRFPVHQGYPSTTDQQACAAAIARLSITDLIDRPLATLSCGQQQKVMLARALASEAPMILLDEPTANLDIAAALGFMQTLKELTRSEARPRTIVLAQHDLLLAERFADQCICLDDGRIVASGPMRTTLTPELLRRVFQVEATSVSLGAEQVTVATRPIRD